MIPDLKNGMSIIICNGILSGFGKSFSKLQNETRLKLPFYNDEVDSCEMKKVQIPIVGVIVIEGVFYSEKNGEISFIIWCTWIVQERQDFYARVRNTENLSKFENRYWKAEDYYLETELPEGLGGFSYKLI